MISDAVMTSIVQAIRDVLVTGVAPTLAIIGTYIASKRRKKRDHAAVMKKLEAIDVSHAATIEKCTDTVSVLSDQVSRLREGSRPDDVAPPRRTA